MLRVNYVTPLLSSVKMTKGFQIVRSLLKKSVNNRKYPVDANPILDKQIQKMDGWVGNDCR